MNTPSIVLLALIVLFALVALWRYRRRRRRCDDGCGGCPYHKPQKM